MGQNRTVGWRLVADAVLVIHLGFVLFIVAGGALVRARSWVLVPHLASLAYGAAIEVIGFTCPLTPLEKSLRRAAGDAGYEGGFVDHYITSLLYPGELTGVATAALIASVAMVNAATYYWVLRRPRTTVAVV